MGETLITAIDGDVASFFDTRELSFIFTTDELRSYLSAEGHPEADVTTTIDRWQILYFEQGRGDGWRLNVRGRALVEEIRNTAPDPSGPDRGAQA